MKNRRLVFVIHGRNKAALQALTEFLGSLGLQTLDWNGACEKTGRTAPTIYDVVDAGLAAAQAIIALFTPDEIVQLRRTFAQPGDSQHPDFQSRPNVVFEAGMAFGRDREHTIPVRLGTTRDFSDLAGVNYVQLDNSIDARENLRSRLNAAHCDLSNEGSDYRTAGDFEAALDQSSSQSDALLVEMQELRGPAVFESSACCLERDCHDELRVYAPTGVWKQSSVKAKWFGTVAACLIKDLTNEWPAAADYYQGRFAEYCDRWELGPRQLNTSLGHFVGVYGLPPRPCRQGSEQRLEEFGAQLNILEELLTIFDGIPTAHLYYLTVDTAQIPGTAVMSVDDAVFLGFAVRGQFAIDYGILFDGAPGVTQAAEKWFSTHVLGVASQNLIQDVRAHVCVGEGINRIRAEYGLPPSAPSSSCSHDLWFPRS